jgi:hypothetical protein
MRRDTRAILGAAGLLAALAGADTGARAQRVALSATAKAATQMTATASEPGVGSVTKTLPAGTDLTNGVQLVATAGRSNAGTYAVVSQSQSSSFYYRLTETSGQYAGSSSTGPHETVLRLRSSVPALGQIRLSWTSNLSGDGSQSKGEVDIGDDGTFEWASTQLVEQFDNPMILTPAGIDIRTRTRSSSSGFGGISSDLFVFFQPVLATWRALGASCSGSFGPPVLAPQNPGDRPILGQTFTTIVRPLPSSQQGICWGIVGTSTERWGPARLPLDLGKLLGMTGCVLYTDLGSFRPLPNHGGYAVWAIPIPHITELLGRAFYQQAFVFDAGANPFGATTSNAGAGVIGTASGW